MKAEKTLKELVIKAIHEWWILAIGVVLFGVVGYFAGKHISKPTFESTRQVQVFEPGQSSYYQIQGLLSMMQTYQVLGRGSDVLSTANNHLKKLDKKYAGSPSDLRGMTEVSNEPNSQILDFSVTSLDASFSKKAAKAIAVSFTNQITTLSQSKAVKAKVLRQVEGREVVMHPSQAKKIAVMLATFGFFFSFLIIVYLFYREQN